jgi:chromosome segregation ATPase
MQSLYMQLKKVINAINTDYEKVKNESFVESDWQNQGKKIRNDINTFHKLKNEINIKVNYVRSNSLNGNDEKSTLDQIDNLLEKARNTTEPQIEAINEKTKYFNSPDIEMAPSQPQSNEQPQQEIVMDLMNNKEVLEQRRKELESIQKTSAMLKDTTAQMVVDVNKQGAMLDDIETHVNTASDNAQKAKKEIVKADEISRGNRKSMICLIIIILLALGGIGAILGAVVF